MVPGSFRRVAARGRTAAGEQEIKEPVTDASPLEAFVDVNRLSGRLATASPALCRDARRRYSRTATAN